MVGNLTSFNYSKIIFIDPIIKILRFERKLKNLINDLQIIEQTEGTTLAVIQLVNVANAVQDQKIINTLIDHFTTHTTDDDNELIGSLRVIKEHVNSLCNNPDRSFRVRICRATRVNTIHISDVTGKRSMAASEWLLAGPKTPLIENEVRYIIKSHTEPMKEILEKVRMRCELKCL
jgi:hypothetical protein